MSEGKKSHKLTKFPLKTVRPFYIKTVSLFDLDEKISAMGKRAQGKTFTEHALEFCARHVEDLIEQSVREHSGNSQQPKLPLIRLRVEHGNQHETFGPHLLARQFPDRVANPRDVVLFTKRRGVSDRGEGAVDLNRLGEVANPEAFARSRVEDLVREYFETVDEDMHLTVLTDAAMQQSVNLFVDKDVTDAIMGAVKMQEARALGELGDVSEAKLVEEICHLRTKFATQPDISADEIQQRVTSLPNRRERNFDSDSDEVSRIEDDDDIDDAPPPTRSRGRGASSARRGRGRARAASSSASSPAASGRGRRRKGVNL